MAECRINASMNMWFEKLRKKIHESFKNLDEEIEEDILFVVVKEGGFLSFWDKYPI